MILETQDCAGLDDLVAMALALADEQGEHVAGAHLSAALEALRRPRRTSRRIDEISV
jgi:hypothetical protein